MPDKDAAQQPIVVDTRVFRNSCALCGSVDHTMNQHKDAKDEGKPRDWS